MLRRPLHCRLLVVVHRCGSAASDFNKLIVVYVLVGIVVAPSENSFKVISPREKLILLEEVAKAIQSNLV
jgi:hypothetical protein